MISTLLVSHQESGKPCIYFSYFFATFHAFIAYFEQENRNFKYMDCSGKAKAKSRPSVASHSSVLFFVLELFWKFFRFFFCPIFVCMHYMLSEAGTFGKCG